MPKLIKLETDANVSNYTPEAGNITTFFAEEDGAVKLKYKNSAGEIAELSGGGGGGAGAFDLVTVTAYTPAYANITSLQLSGMSMDDMSGTDFSAANGTYTVTAETASLPADKKVFKHSSANYYVTYLPESADGAYYSCGWCLANKATVTDPWGAYMIGPKDLVAGTSYWSDEMGMTSQQVTVSNIQSSQVPADVKFKRVTGYNSSTMQYTIAEDEESCSIADNSALQVHHIYNFNGTAIIGRPVDCEGGSHLLTYIPWRDSNTVEKVTNGRVSGYYEYVAAAWQYPSFRMAFYYDEAVARFSPTTIDGKSCAGSLNYSAEITSDADFNQYYAEYDGKLGSYNKNTNRHWSMGCLVHGGNQKNKKQRPIFCQLNNVARMSIDIEWNSSTPRVVVYRDDTAVITYANASLSSGWHHVLLTYDHDNTLFVLYVDGAKRGEYSFSFERKGYYDTIYFGTGRDDGSYAVCYLCELKFWNIPLTAEQAMAEYNRAINS